MSIQEIDEFMALPARTIAWNEDPYPLTDGFRRRELRWSIHNDNVDTGFMLVASYPATNYDREFSLSLRRKFDFCRLDMRQEQRTVSMQIGVAIGPIFYPWQNHRELWLNGEGKYGKLSAYVKSPIGAVTVETALDWFLAQHGISAHGKPLRIRLGR